MAFVLVGGTGGGSSSVDYKHFAPSVETSSTAREERLGRLTKLTRTDLSNEHQCELN